MKTPQEQFAWCMTVTLGNEEAASFMMLWKAYIHAIDDLVDSPERPSPEALLATFASAITLYSHPFYLKHLFALRQIALNVTNTYADVVDFEKSDVEWKKQWADHYRHCGVDMIMAIASICGGYANMRSFSRDMISVCHHDHHDAEGKPE